MSADFVESVKGSPAKRQKVAAKPPVARKKLHRGLPASDAATDSGSAEVGHEPDTPTDASRPSTKPKRVTRQTAPVSGEAGHQGRAAGSTAARVPRKKSEAGQKPEGSPLDASPDGDAPGPKRRQRGRSKAQPAKAVTAAPIGRQESAQGWQHDMPENAAAEAEPCKPTRQRQKGRKRKAASRGTPVDTSEREELDASPIGATTYNSSLTMAAVGGRNGAAGDASSSYPWRLSYGITNLQNSCIHSNLT
jgi:hypothetical protein